MGSTAHGGGIGSWNSSAKPLLRAADRRGRARDRVVPRRETTAWSPAAGPWPRRRCGCRGRHGRARRSLPRSRRGRSGRCRWISSGSSGASVPTRTLHAYAATPPGTYSRPARSGGRDLGSSSASRVGITTDRGADLVAYHLLDLVLPRRRPVPALGWLAGEHGSRSRLRQVLAYLPEGVVDQRGNGQQPASSGRTHDVRVLVEVGGQPLAAGQVRGSAGRIAQPGARRDQQHLRGATQREGRHAELVQSRVGPGQRADCVVTHGREQDAAVGVHRFGFGLAAPDDDAGHDGRAIPAGAPATNLARRPRSR